MFSCDSSQAFEQKKYANTEQVETGFYVILLSYKK